MNSDEKQPQQSLQPQKVEQAPVLTPEEERILDEIWDEIGRQRLKPPEPTDKT